MKTILCANQNFTVATVTANDPKTPASRLTSDKMNTVFKWSGNNTITIHKTDAQSFDTVALMGAEIPSGTTVIIRGFTNVADANHAWTTTQTMPVAAAGRLPILFYRHPAAGIYRKIVISITTSATCRIARILVGKSVLAPFVEADAKFGYDDHSEAFAAAGFESFIEHPRYPYWDITVPLITDADARAIWKPFMSAVGISRPFLFIPIYDDPTTYQSDWLYGRNASSPFLQARSGVDAWAFSSKIKGIIR